MLIRKDLFDRLLENDNVAALSIKYFFLLRFILRRNGSVIKIGLRCMAQGHPSKQERLLCVKWGHVPYTPRFHKRLRFQFKCIRQSLQLPLVIRYNLTIEDRFRNGAEFTRYFFTSSKQLHLK